MAKFVTVCEGGNVRSVCMALHLKDGRNEAIATGWRFTTPDTFKTLNNWADHFILMEPHFLDKVPDEIKSKCLFVDVGVDRYGNPFHSELMEQCKNGAEWLRKYLNL